MAKLRSASAKFEQVLFYLEDPEVIILSSGPKSKIIAVATNRIGGAGFLGAKISIGQFEDYLKERFDLRFLMLRPDRSAWYEFSLPLDLTKRIRLSEVELTADYIERFVPDHGFFARDHSVDYQIAPQVKKDTQRFEVDGKWNMREFGRFHSQISDLYSLSRSIELFANGNTPLDTKKKILDAFVKPWEGGGSYYGFFKSVAKVSGPEYQPEIKAIAWASPGHIDVMGERSSFQRLLALLQHFSTRRTEIIEDYEHLWSFLQEMKLLNKTSRNLDRKSGAALEIDDRARTLANSLSIAQYDTIKLMAGGDPAIASKVLLAAKRRVQRLHDFFVQGRVAVVDIEI